MSITQTANSKIERGFILYHILEHFIFFCMAAKFTITCTEIEQQLNHIDMNSTLKEKKIDDPR
jgi:hypothetical protein